MSTWSRVWDVSNVLLQRNWGCFFREQEGLIQYQYGIPNKALSDLWSCGDSCWSTLLIQIQFWFVFQFAADHVPLLQAHCLSLSPPQPQCGGGELWNFFLFPLLLPGWSALRREPEWKQGVIEFPVIKMRSALQRQQRIIESCPWDCGARDGRPLCTVYLWMLMPFTGSSAFVLGLSPHRLCWVMVSFYVMIRSSPKGLPQQCCRSVHETRPLFCFPANCS